MSAIFRLLEFNRSRTHHAGTRIRPIQGQVESRYAVSHYRWNWWFPEDYSGLTFDNGQCGDPYHEVNCPKGQIGTTFLRTGDPCPQTNASGANCSAIQAPQAINVLSAIRDGSTYAHLWNWFVFRQPFGQRGARMMYVYVRRDLLPSNETSSGSFPYAKALSYRIHAFPRHPASMLLNPHGLAVGPRGNVYVANSGDHTIDVFNSSGRRIQVIGSGHESWSVQHQ